jgi:hypothetical protein
LDKHTTSIYANKATALVGSGNICDNGSTCFSSMLVSNVSSKSRMLPTQSNRCLTNRNSSGASGRLDRPKGYKYSEIGRNGQPDVGDDVNDESTNINWSAAKAIGK